MTVRNLSADFIAAVESGQTRPRLFFEGVFASGTLNLWSGYGDIAWDAKTWTGAGNVIGISSIKETSELKAVQFTISLNGIDSSILAIALNQCRAARGQSGTVWLGLLDSSGAVIADPFQSFSGRLSMPDVVDAGETCTISVSYESRLIGGRRRRIRYYTPESQKIDYPADRGFDQVVSLQDARLAWGRPG